MKTVATSESVQEFADTIKDNPEKIIAWARSEICAYQELIKLLEKRLLKWQKTDSGR